MKKFIKIFIFSFLCYFSFIEAQAADNQREFLKNFFSEPFEESVSDGDCQIRCRAVNEDHAETYITKIIDYDATTGVTTCDVLPANQSYNSFSKMSIMANYKDKDCQKLYSDIIPNYKDTELASVQYMNGDKSKDVKVTIDDENDPEKKYNRSRVSLAKLITGVSVMDLDIIDLKATIDTKGTFTRTDNASLNTYLLNSQKPEDVSTANDNLSSGQSGTTSPSAQSSDRLYDISDKISKENLGYYADLIYYLNELRNYAATFLYIAIALAFAVMYFTKFVLKKVAKKPTTYDEAWTIKFVKVVVVSFVFFIGIRFDEKFSSTVFLDILKVVISESSSIADRANMIGMRVLEQNEFNKTGINGVESEANLKNLLDKQKYLVQQYNELLDDCADKYPSENTFQEINPAIIARIEVQASRSERRGVAEENPTKLIYKGCRSIEKRYKVAVTSQEQLGYMLSRVQSAYRDNIVVQKLQEIDNYMASSVTNIGWFSVALAPTLPVLIENAYMQGSNSTPPPINIDEQREQGEMFEAKINEANDKQIAIREGDQVGGNALSNLLNSNPEQQKQLGEFFGNFTQTLNPLYNPLNNFISTQLASPEIQQILKMTHIKKDNTDKVDQNEMKLASQNLTVLIVDKLNDIAPSAFAFIATALMIILYNYKLIIYAFISPFTVLFAFATGENRKVIDFLVTGVVLFLTPPVIVLAVYIALFLGQEFNDIFMAMIDEQIRLSLLSSASFWGQFQLTTILGFCKVFAVFAKCLIIWKIIMNMPSLVFRMVGLDRGDGTSALGDAMQGAMTKRIK